jgi:MEMO1 family protein
MPDPPKLRPLEAFPVEVDGKRLICLRDPSGLSEHVALVPRPVLFLLALLDGSRDLGALQADFVRAGGELVSRDAIAGLVDQLDQAFLLDSERFRAHRDRVAAEYHAAPTRPAAHAGASYPAEPQALRAFLDGLFASGSTEGDSPQRTTARATKGRRSRRPAPVRAVVAPHIDFDRGGRLYALAYRALLDEPPPDLYVVLGTDHNGDGARYSLTCKPFDTPLGPVATDADVVETVARRAGTAMLQAELNHRREHSIEFQAVVLRYLADCRGGGPAPPMLPILCGFFYQALASEADPAADQFLADLCGAIREAVAGRRVVWIAAADLAHVGPHFGDPRPLQASDLKALGEHDAALLATVTAGDAAAFYRLLAEERDRRRVCGLPPIYTMLRLCGKARGEVLGYEQCPADDGSRVSVAAVVLRTR